MFVGQTGVGRVIQRTCELMKAHPDRDVKEFGAIPLEIVQKYINFWASSSNDLFGAEVSSNAANFFRAGLKGRAYEEKYEDHLALEQTFTIERVVDGRLSSEEVALRNAMNEVLRTKYIEENEKSVEYWNRICEKMDVDFRFELPDKRFHRTIGVYSEGTFDPRGNPIPRAEYEANVERWLPTPADKAYVKSLMKAVREPGKFAAWIAPPAKGINSMPVEFEYVRL